MAQGSRSPFLDRVRDALRVRHYSYRTEQTYIHWIRRYILFHHKTHPEQMGEAQVAGFLTHLAVDRNVSPSTQNQALNALVFLYRQVLERPLGNITDAGEWGWQYVFPADRVSRDPRSGVQEQLGHTDVRTTRIYTHVIQRGGYAVKSPLGAVLASDSNGGAYAGISAGT